MTRQSTAKRPVFSASGALQALGDALGQIKADDGLTWADVGAVLGVSDDQAAKYAEGSAAMNAVAFGRGKREWNGRFTGVFDRLCVESRPASISDRECETRLVKAALAMSEALSDDNAIDGNEIAQNRKTLERARDALEALLRKSPVRAA